MKLPDNDTIMGEVHTLAREARGEAATPSGGQGPRPTGVSAPIFMGKDHEVIPDHYVLHWSETTCRNCGHVETSSDFFALSYIRSRVNGTRVKHLTKCASPLFNLRVERLRTRSDTTPFCASCTTLDLSHLPPPPEESKLRSIPEPQLKGGKKPSEPKHETAKPQPKKPSLDDLI